MANRPDTDPLNIFRVLNKIDRKDYDFYDTLTEEQQKSIPPFVIMKWGANVYDDPDIQAYYIRSANANCNENFFDLHRHKKLQYLSCCAISPNLGTPRHYWLTGNTNTKATPLQQFVQNEFPEMNAEEVELFITTHSREDLKSWLEQHGLENKNVLKILPKKKS